MKGLVDRHLSWIKAMAALGLILFLPFLLLKTPLAPLARLWGGLWTLSLFLFFMAMLLGAMVGVELPPLVWLEGHVRGWVARFSKDPEALWLHWARHAHYPAMARTYLDRAVLLGGREAAFQESLVFLEGGMGAGGQRAGVERLRLAALRGHAEAAFRLAEALRTGHGQVVRDTNEAETWYRRSATLGHGPAAAWLAHAYQTGDGVAVDEAQAREWAAAAQRLLPHPEASHSLLRHEAGPQDPLVGMARSLIQGAETTADQVIAHRSGRWLLLLGAGGMALVALYVTGTIFWAGSAGLFHLPLFMASPLVLMLAWQAYQLRKEGPRRGRDRLRQAAEAGDPEACYQLGLAHRKGGPHLSKDDLTAAIWFRKAAETGHRGAMEAMAEAYLGGHGVMRDPRESAKWAEAARRESTS